MIELKIAEDALREIVRLGRGVTPGVPGEPLSATMDKAATVAIFRIEAVRAKRRAEKDELAEVYGSVTGVPIEAQRATWGPSGGTPPEPAYIDDFDLRFEIEGKPFSLLDYSKTEDLANAIEAHLMSALAAHQPDPYDDPER